MNRIKCNSRESRNVHNNSFSILRKKTNVNAKHNQPFIEDLPNTYIVYRKRKKL